jgi:hypothetical protein
MIGEYMAANEHLQTEHYRRSQSTECSTLESESVLCAEDSKRENFSRLPSPGAKEGNPQIFSLQFVAISVDIFPTFAFLDSRFL